MSKCLALIHTVGSLQGVFAELARELLPGVETFNVVDESMLRHAIRDGGMTPITMRRVAAHIVSAELAGADAILVTCSSIGPAVDASRPFVSVPLVRVDDAMAREAVKCGPRIAALATLHSTLGPTSSLIRQTAEVVGKEVELKASVVEGAFDALAAGDVAQHDRLVLEALRRAIEGSDVVVLAQASMARVAGGLGEEDPRIPILSSPRLSVAQVATILGSVERSPRSSA